MSNTVISVEHLTKKYDLGVIGTGTLTRDLERWWASVRKQPDPYSIIGHEDQFSRNGQSILALDDISFTVQQGEALGIIGKNGAGKSTLLKILSRVTAPTSGMVRVKGRIGSLLEVGTGFHPELTGRENVYLNGAILGMRKEEVTRKFDEIVDFSGVEKFIDTPVKRYSSGMYVRLGFAVAAHLDPEILIVDEVLAVGDAEFQKKCLGKMGEVAGEGRTVLLVSHNMASIENLCKRALLIKSGKIFLDNNTNKVIQSYLNLPNNEKNKKTDVANISERSGTGIIKLIDFDIEDEFGNIINVVRSGMKIAFVFKYKFSKNFTGAVNNVDFGFSIAEGSNNHALTILYSSFQNVLFKLNSEYGKIRLFIESFPFAKGRYRIGGRITIDGIESDWPKMPIAYIDVIEGDFYQTGKGVNANNAPILIKGEWIYNPE